MMSEGGEERSEVVASCCAECGIIEIDDIKLVPCDGCDLVKYCSDECQGNHKSEHKEACKQRAAELREELLFKQPEGSSLGDCPICMLPLPIDVSKSTLKSCCSKIICNGCYYANRMREKEMRLPHTCPFCRKLRPESGEEFEKQRMKRIEVNDPNALCRHGVDQYNKGDYRSAFEYWTKAVELGVADAHYSLSGLYHYGKGVERNLGKIIHHLEEAAIGGHQEARYNLGRVERNKGNIERAVKHWVIAATQGDDKSTKALIEEFKGGNVSKDDLASALRAHQAAVDATKSPQREAAEKTRGSIF